MKIIMTKRKNGIYSQWYEVFGIDEKGDECWYLIFQEQANTYAKAVKYWNEKWGKNNKAIYLRNAEPYNNQLAIAC